MPEILVRDIDEMMVERIKQVARERGWTLNEVMLQAARFALGMGGEDFSGRDRRDIATMRGTWSSGETDAFREALDAFEHVDSEPLFEGPIDPAE